MTKLISSTNQCLLTLFMCIKYQKSSYNVKSHWKVQGRIAWKGAIHILGKNMPMHGPYPDIVHMIYILLQKKRNFSEPIYPDDPGSGSVTQGHRDKWVQKTCVSFEEECISCGQYLNRDHAWAYFSPIYGSHLFMSIRPWTFQYDLTLYLIHMNRVSRHWLVDEINFVIIEL